MLNVPPSSFVETKLLLFFNSSRFEKFGLWPAADTRATTHHMDGNWCIII